MKNTKILILLLSLFNVLVENAVAIMFNTVFALLFSMLLGINPFIPVVIWNILAIRLGKKPTYNTILRAGVQKEIWLAEIMERFYPLAGWLTKARDLSAFVENNTINLADAGVMPEVYVNNTTYPIPIEQRADNPIAIQLDVLDTKNTIVRNTEAIEAAYPKLQSVIKKHKNALRLRSYQRAAHAYAPNSNTANTPVLVATGADDGTGRKRLTLADIAKAQTALEEMDGIATEITKSLVLCSKHKQDLILEDKDLLKTFANIQKGQILPLFNFDIFLHNSNAIYDTSTGLKKAFGAVPGATDSKATSFFFVNDEVMRSDGDYDMFYEYKTTGQRGDVIGFQKRFIALPMRNLGIGAIYSGS